MAEHVNNVCTMTLKLSDKKLAVLGTGKLGGILLRAYLKQGLFAPNNVTATVKHAEKAASLAKELGAGPEVARDVGQAMARNPVPLIIPCHRVLAAGGKVGGFSAPGGSVAKAHMLELEGVRVAPPPPVQRSLGL